MWQGSRQVQTGFSYGGDVKRGNCRIQRWPFGGGKPLRVLASGIQVFEGADRHETGQ